MIEQNFEKNIVVTGANGFIGKNLCLFLKEHGYTNINKITRDTNQTELKKHILEADFIFNLAGVNRPKDETEFKNGNADFLQDIVSILVDNNKNTPIMLSSSTQALIDNPYGRSKKEAEDILNDYAKRTGADVYIYRFTNVFGKWSKPNYNSVVATFCYNIARDIPITINDPDAKLNLVYIDDVCKDLLGLLECDDLCINSAIVRTNFPDNGTDYKDIRVDYKDTRTNFADICNGRPVGDIPIYTTTVGELADIIKSFREIRKTFYTPRLDGLNKYLYSTYLSFLDVNDFSYPLIMHKDDRGSFTEILKTLGDGQFSVNISKPGITKGGHYHNTKNEKFIVVSGKALIEFISLNPSDNINETIKYEVSGDDIKVVDIPCGYSHTIKNIGDSDLVTFMWANEVFDKEQPDTFMLHL